TDEFKEFCRDICLHIAAAQPTCVSREEFPADLLEKEREIAAEAVKDKPANVVQKVVEGKIEKIYQQHCLLDQPFVKSQDGQSVSEVLTQKIAKLGENMIIRRFVRFQLGQ